MLFAIGTFLVRFQDQNKKMFLDLIEVTLSENNIVPPQPSKVSKTWDEKYEEELDAMKRRLRADSGLLDLEKQNLSWGVPPALNPQNAKGLTIDDK